MKRAFGAASPYAVMQRPSAGGPSLPSGDPVDPTQRSQPSSRLQPNLPSGDPIDPTQGRQPVSTLVPVVNAKRTKQTRRAQRAVKPTKRRASSRRR